MRQGGAQAHDREYLECGSPAARSARRRWRRNRKSCCGSMAHGGRPLEQLGKATIDRSIEDIAHLSPGTRRQYVSKVRHFLAWAHDEHGVPDLPKYLPRFASLAPFPVPGLATRS